MNKAIKVVAKPRTRKAAPPDTELMTFIGERARNNRVNLENDSVLRDYHKRMFAVAVKVKS